VRAALRGEAGWHVDEVGSGDVVARRGADPVVAAQGQTAGAVVVNVLIPFSQARQGRDASAPLERLSPVSGPAGHIRTAYSPRQLLLAFSVGPAVPGSMSRCGWASGSRKGRSRTDPAALAEGTAEEVARGNLDVSVPRQATTRSAPVGSFTR